MNKKESIIILPNNVVYNPEYEGDTYLSEYGDKITHILSYMSCKVDKLGETNFSLKNIITTCGLKPKYGKGKTTDSFLTIITQMQENNILKLKEDLSKVKVNDYIRGELNISLNKKEDSNNKNKDFFIIKCKDYLSLSERYMGDLSRVILLKLFYYLSARILKPKKGEITCKPECLYEDYNRICYDLTMNHNTLSKYTKELNNLGLVFCDNIGVVRRYDGKIHYAGNVYALDEANLEKGLEESKRYYKNKRYSILGK